eukprot:Skav223989  [mRNA]  locus=scaffold6785:25553:26569:+ [translate_table: standard]
MISPALRGHVLEDVARKVYQRHHPKSAIHDPTPGYRCDGKRRSSNQAEFDWMCDEIRVQCKSGRLRWGYSGSGNSWQCQFSCIKPIMLDQLFLVLYGPIRLHFILHDGQTGLLSAGRGTSSSGNMLRYKAPVGITCPEEAQAQILEKMEQQACTIIDSLDTSDGLILQAVHPILQTQKYQLEISGFENHPLSGTTPGIRGMIIQDFVQEIDGFLNNVQIFSENKRSHFDWHRNGVFVECKHSRMAWCSHQKNWICRFSGIKSEHFDLLYLALDTPSAINILKFEGSKYVTSNGMWEDSKGKNIQIRGPKMVTDWSEALDVIMRKLITSGSEHVACVKW